MKKILYILLPVILLLGACSKDKMPLPLDEKILIEMREAWAGKLLLICKTETSYPCGNYTIRTSFNMKNNKIEVKFKNINIPEFCLTSVEPAQVVLEFEDLSDKTYKVEFHHNKTKTSGRLVVSDKGYALELDSQDKIVVETPYLSK